MSSVKQKQAAIALVRELGFAFSINVVLHRANLDRIGEIIDLAAELGADRLELANTQYYGWGLHEPGVAHADAGSRSCAPRRSPSDAMAALSRAGCRSSSCCPTTTRSYPKACYGGWGKVLHRGDRPTAGAALPRRDAHHDARRFANVREHSLRLDLAASRRRSRRFAATSWMKEPCRSCPRKAVDFGGCRCQAFALTGDAANADPVCTLSPIRHVIDEALHEHAGADRRISIATSPTQPPRA